MTKKVPPGGQKIDFTKNRLREVDQHAMQIGKMVSLLILPFGNPKSANGRHPYLRILFPFMNKYVKLFDQVLILQKFSNFRLWCPEIAEFQNGIIDYGP